MFFKDINFRKMQEEEETYYVPIDKFEEVVKKLIRRIKAMEDRLEKLEEEHNEQIDSNTGKLSSMKFQFSKDKN